MFVSLSQIASPNESKASYNSESFMFALLPLVTHKTYIYAIKYNAYH